MSKKITSQLGILPDYERHIYKGIKCKTDELKENAMIKKSLSKVLGVDVDMELETGEKVNVTIADVIAIATVEDAIKKPSSSKMKDLAAVNGELKETVNVNLRSPQELFGHLVSKDEEDTLPDE